MEQTPGNTPPERSQLALRTRALRVCLGVGALAIACVAGVILFPNVVVNRVLKPRLERAYAAAHPNNSLRIIGLHYSLWHNRLACDSLTLESKHSGASWHVAGLSVKGLRWSRLRLGKHSAPDALAHAEIDATNLVASLPKAGYEFRCGRLHAALADSAVLAEAIRLRPAAGDEQFFAAREFRRTRFDLAIAHCQILGLAGLDLLQGKACRARSIVIRDASLDAYLNRDKPANPQPRGPFTLREVLLAVPIPLTVDRLEITHGQLSFRERVLPGAEPGLLTFDAIRLSAEGLSNQADAKAAVVLNGRAKLMNACTFKLVMEIPIGSPERSLHYTGSFSAMDLPALNPFLEPAAHARIKSGTLQDADFNVTVAAGHAGGTLRALYRDLDFAFLDPGTGAESGLDNQVKSFLANRVALRTSNPPEHSDSIKLGVIDYTWKPDERFLHFSWFALRSGIYNVLGLDEFVNSPK